MSKPEPPLTRSLSVTRPTADLKPTERLVALARLHFEPRRLLALVIAVTIGAIAAQTVRSAQTTVDALGQTSPVVVAVTDLEPGHVIAAGDVVIEQWPLRFIAPLAAGTPAQVMGDTVRSTIFAGEAITHRRTTDDRFGLLANERGVTLPQPLAPPPVVPGDHVDLMGVGLVPGTEVVTTSHLGGGRVIHSDEFGITIAVPEHFVSSVVEYLATGTVEVVFVPFGP